MPNTAAGSAADIMVGVTADSAVDITVGSGAGITVGSVADITAADGTSVWVIMADTTAGFLITD